MSKILVIASGYFNPLHKGHIEYLNQSKALGDHLFVIVNSDEQIALKGSKVFQDIEERTLIVDNLKCVDLAVSSIDHDRSVSQTIRFIYHKVKIEYDAIIFTNGGDQTLDTILENEVCDELGIRLVDGLGNKIQSSSWLKDKL
jgi:cytidyltransferase-like protein